MKLMIELNCYEELKNIAKTANNKIRKVKRLFYVSCAMIYISVIGMIYAICFNKTILTIVFFILALLFFMRRHKNTLRS
jgi:amino acid permease